MKICGKDGTELRCFKNGLVVYDENFHPHDKHAADGYFCPTCKAVLIERNDQTYNSPDEPAHLKIVREPGTNKPSLAWDHDFRDSVWHNYGFDLCLNY